MAGSGPFHGVCVPPRVDVFSCDLHRSMARFCSTMWRVAVAPLCRKGICHRDVLLAAERILLGDRM